VSAWISPGAEDIISKYHVQNILPAGFGSGMVGMCLKSGETVWGLHFPLDFKGDGEKNNNYIAMVELQKVMKAYPGSVCAMGDFNTIPGKIEDLMMSAISDEFKFLLKDFYSFFGLYFDTIDVKRDESVIWKHISEMP